METGNRQYFKDIALGLSRDRQNIFLEQLDLVRVSRINTLRVPLAHENAMVTGS